MIVRALILVILMGTSGCSLVEVRSKWKGGVEARSTSANTNHNRWLVQAGLDFKFDNGHTVGWSVRRRDIDHSEEGFSADDTGVWLEYSFPLWKAESKTSQLQHRIEVLELEMKRLSGR